MHTFRKTLPGLFIALAFSLVSPQSIFCQSQTVKIENLVGNWGFGHSLMLTYLDYGRGNYSQSGNIYGMKYSIKHDGTFSYKFAARINDKTIREWGLGTVILTDSVITFKFDNGSSERYRFVSLITNSKGEVILSLVQDRDTRQSLKCGHSRGHFDCTGPQEWALRVHGQ